MVERRVNPDRRSAPRGADRRRGRPPLTPEERRNRQTIHVQLPAELHDAICQIALRNDVSVNAAMRELLKRALASDLLLSE